VKERTVQRAALYVADELFFSGTAAEITPIRSVDRIVVGSGGRGRITEKIQTAFFEVTKGERKAPGDWLTYVREHRAAEARNNGQQKRASREVATPTSKRAESVLKYQTAAIATD
jgi:hypothetical protein